MNTPFLRKLFSAILKSILVLVIIFIVIMLIASFFFTGGPLGFIDMFIIH